jgi:CTP:molybdopterin cytidylyltransferase MocA
MTDQPTVDDDQTRRIATLTAAVAELTQRIAEIEGDPVVVDAVLPNRFHERRTVQNVRRGDGRVVQRVTSGP